MARGLRGNAVRNGARWSGTLDALAVAPSTGTRWTLQAPARWGWER